MSARLLIVGVSGYLGQALVRRLIRENPFESICGVDARPPRLLGPVQYIRGDVDGVDVGDLLVMNAIDTVIHLACSARAVGELLEVAGILGLRRVVLRSRDVVYRQTLADAGEPRSEDAELWGEAEAPPEVAELAAMERLVEKAGQVEVVRLRLSHLLGPLPGGALDGFLQLPWLPAPMGVDPVTHALHVEDAAELLVRAALQPDVRGAFNAGGGEPLRLSEVAGLLEKPTLALPEWLGRTAAGGFRALKLRRDPPADPRLLRWSVPLVCERMHTELDFKPRFTTRQALAVWRARYTGE